MSVTKFKYHLSPESTGSLLSINITCTVCGQHNRYKYVGPLYSEEELEIDLCPDCIKNGKAAKDFEIEFFDRDSIGNDGRWQQVSEEVKDIICYKTPGFSGWQQEKWWTHCDDAAKYLGPKIDIENIINSTNNLTDLIMKDMDINKKEATRLLIDCSAESSPTLFLFKCLHCEQYGGYIDFD